MTVYAITLLSIPIFIKYINNWGLHIINDKLYYKGLIYREINPKQIIAVKILREQMAKLEIGTYTHTMYYLKDSTGNFLYNAVFLNEINDEIKQFNGGNYDFRQKFKDSVIFTTVYDAEAVKKLCL